MQKACLEVRASPWCTLYPNHLGLTKTCRAYDSRLVRLQRVHSEALSVYIVQGV